MKRAGASRLAGFTLIEVMVALVVIALALGGLIASGGSYAKNAAYLREKTVAMWVAHNRLIEFQLENPWPDTDKTNGNTEMAGADWRWEILVQETPDENLRRIDISVALKDEPDAPLALLSSFVGRINSPTL